MKRVTDTDLRQNLARYMDDAVGSGAPIVVTRQDGKGNVVLLSEREFTAWQETVHLLSNPANAHRLLASIRSADAGQVSEHPLTPPPQAGTPIP